MHVQAACESCHARDQPLQPVHSTFDDNPHILSTGSAHPLLPAHVLFMCTPTSVPLTKPILVSDAMHKSASYRSMALLDSIFTHDVEDAMPDRIPIAPTPREPCHCQPGKEPALGILAGPGLQCHTPCL